MNEHLMRLSLEPGDGGVSASVKVVDGGGERREVNNKISSITSLTIKVFFVLCFLNKK